MHCVSAAGSNDCTEGRADSKGRKREPISWDSFGNNAILQAGYILVFGALAFGRFTTKDILS